jgi:hypothetical protein
MIPPPEPICQVHCCTQQKLQTYEEKNIYYGKVHYGMRTLKKWVSQTYLVYDHMK